MSNYGKHRKINGTSVCYHAFHDEMAKNAVDYAISGDNRVIRCNSSGNRRVNSSELQLSVDNCRKLDTKTAESECCICSRSNSLGHLSLSACINVVAMKHA